MNKTAGLFGLTLRAVPRFQVENRGVAAIEFALLVPLMIAIFVLTLEFAQAIDTSRKLARMTSQIGDLIAQDVDMTPAKLQSIVKIGEATMQPYQRSQPAIRITSIDVTGTKSEATVAWSKCYYSCAALPASIKGAKVPLADTLKISGLYLIRVETSLAYQPMIAWSDGAMQLLRMTALDSIHMSEKYDQHPRRSTTIPCSTC